MRRIRIVLSSSVALSIAVAVACGGDEAAPVVPEVPPPDAAPEAMSPVEPADGGVDAPHDTGSPVGMTLDGGACDGGAVSITRVDPPFGVTTAVTPIAVSGTAFEQTPSFFLRAGGVLTPLSHVAYVNASSVNADVPSGLAAGTYDVAVVNPNGCAAVASGAFRLTSTPVPEIANVSPSTGKTNANVTVTVTGCHFPTAAGAAELSTIDTTGTKVVHAVSSVTCGADAGAPCADNSPRCTLTGTVNVQSAPLAAGAYVVRVTNTSDMTFGEHSVFTVTNPDGKLVGAWAAAPSLNVARRSHASLAGRISNAKRFLYSVGGEDATGAPLASVEVAPLDRFGRVGTWFVQRNQLTQARSGLALTRHGQYLYAIGGTASVNGTGGAAPSGTGLTSVERAKILDPADAPVLAQATTSTASGALPAGQYYYKVAAVLNGTDADNPNGETLASDEVVASLAANGVVNLQWTAVAGAASYTVYRSPTPNSPSESEVFLRNVGNVLTYSDTGADTVGGDAGLDAGTDGGGTGLQRPLQVGSTGVWRTLVASPLLAARINASAVIGVDATGGVHLYVVGGYGTCPGAVTPSAIMACYERADLSANGAVVALPFVAGTQSLRAPRMRHGLDAITALNGPSTFSNDGGANNATFLVVGGGRGVQSTGNTIEYALVGPGGVLGAWANTTGSAVERDGSRLLVANGYAYSLLGGTLPMNYRNTGDISTSILASPTAITLGNWSNSGGSGAPAVGRYGLAAESAYFYVIGGTTNDTDASNGVYQIIH